MAGIINLGARSNLTGLSRRDRFELLGDLADKVLEPRKMRLSADAKKEEAEAAKLLETAALELGFDPELCAQNLEQEELAELVPLIAERAHELARRGLEKSRRHPAAKT